MTTPTLRETLVALTTSKNHTEYVHALEKTRAALAAQPELPEPVADVDDYGKVKWRDAVPTNTTLYTAAQLQQAVEQAAVNKEAEATADWRRLALQFDGHRMQSLGWLNAILKELPMDAYQQAREFLKALPLSGEQVVAERIAAQAKREILWLVMPQNKNQSHVLFEDGYAEGWEKCLSACKAQIEQSEREPMSETALANQTSRFYALDEMISSGIYMQAWRDAEAHHGIGTDK